MSPGLAANRPEARFAPGQLPLQVPKWREGDEPKGQRPFQPFRAQKHVWARSGSFASRETQRVQTVGA